MDLFIKKTGYGKGLNAMKCADCVYYRELEKWVYNERGCEHIKLDGFACTVFSDDFLKVIWMSGNPAKDITCECFEYCKRVGGKE